MQIDPTYLRYIFDGLDSQSFDKNNVSALPDGLVGIYEEAIPSQFTCSSREKLLSFFVIWALLKKEVSVSFATDLLGWDEQNTIDFLSIYSKWFNSPSSGKYILYHERCRTYLLEKTSSNKLTLANQKIIDLCQRSLESRNGDEWEVYALEHLPSHLIIQAMQNQEEGLAFKKLVSDTGYWNRQLEISKGYDWSKKMLNLAMIWAAKQNTDEIIEYALNKVDLHNMEQNDAPRIVEMVAQNDIETALQRIDAFGGNDKEGLQRKFTLYMLCLMELILLDSKEKPFRKSAIEQILTHLDEKIPVDHSLLNWDDFFSSYIMFKIASELKVIGIDFLRVYNKTDKWKTDWIAEKGPYTQLQLDVLLECAYRISNIYEKSNTLCLIATELAFQGHLKKMSSVMQDVLSFDLSKIENRKKSEAFCFISSELAKQGNIQDAIAYAREINYNGDLIKSLCAICIEYSKKGQVEESILLMQMAIKCARAIKNDSDMITSLSKISTSLFIQKNEEESFLLMDEAIACARMIEVDWEKSSVLRSISIELVKQKKVSEATLLIHEALVSAQQISIKNDELTKSHQLNEISIELAKQNNVDVALKCALSIIDPAYQGSALAYISTELVKQKRTEEAIELARAIKYNFWKTDSLQSISNELAIQNEIEKAFLVIFETLIYTPEIIDYELRNFSLNALCTKLVNKGKIVEAFKCANVIDNDGYKMRWALVSISVELAKSGKIDESLECAFRINDDAQKSSALVIISIELVKQGQINKAIECSKNLTLIYIDDLIKTITAISSQMFRIGRLADLVEYFRSINHEEFKSLALMALSNEYEIHSMPQEAFILLQEALVYARRINNNCTKTKVLARVSTEFFMQGRIEDTSSVLNETLECAYSLDKEVRNSALNEIAVNLCKQGKYKEAERCVLDISSDFSRNFAFSGIASELAKQVRFEEAIACARSINNDTMKSSALTFIAIEIFRQENWKLAEQVVADIFQTSARNNCWKKMAKSIKKQLDWNLSYDKMLYLNRDEAKMFYLKGWAESISVDDISNEIAYKAIQALMNDSTSLENFLQVYAQHELFFGNPTKEKVVRLNKTLNIQWALDIIDQFSKEEHGN
jgi:hypothetical protein